MYKEGRSPDRPVKTESPIIMRNESDDIRYLVIYYLVELGSQEQQSLYALKIASFAIDGRFQKGLPST